MAGLPLSAALRLSRRLYGNAPELEGVADLAVAAVLNPLANRMERNL